MFNLIIGTAKSINNLVNVFSVQNLYKKILDNNNGYKTVGGFTRDDWERVGSDMNKAIINYGKQR